MWMLGNYSFFVRPGMKRVAVITENPDPEKEDKDVMISAYKDGSSKKIVLVAVNVGSVNRKYNLQDLKLKNQTLTPYTTSETSNLGKGTAIKTNEIVVPAKSVVTFVGELE